MVKEDIKKIINSELEQLPNKERIRKLSLFGSYAYGKPKKNSDVDLLIEFKPESKIGFFELVKMQNFLRQRLKKNVDLVTIQSISKYFKNRVLETAEKIYEG
ncbi:MAG: nucleotidyltransferase domain-containing protein [Candidatus Pacebacteria bacterium]|nr:nucleotidyltransferase domain-containing protein [Candidatus Paceibacterota bacterium]